MVEVFGSDILTILSGRNMKKTLIVFGCIVLLVLAVYCWILYPFSLLSARAAIGEKGMATVGDRQVVYYSSGNGPRVILAASLAVYQF